MNNLDLNKIEEKLDTTLENETCESLTNWLKEKRDKNNNMAQQTSVEWLIMQLPVSIRVELYAQDIHVQAKEMHKEDCINFAEQWEARCNEKNMDSKEQLYNEIYNK